jgi:hypothetical protein
MEPDDDTAMIDTHPYSAQQPCSRVDKHALGRRPQVSRII